jgi:hypothetical protein
LERFTMTYVAKPLNELVEGEYYEGVYYKDNVWGELMVARYQKGKFVTACDKNHTPCSIIDITHDERIKLPYTPVPKQGSFKPVVLFTAKNKYK